LAVGGCGGKSPGGSAGDAGPGEGDAAKRFDLRGQLQKGPFIRGSSITIEELDAGFSPTGVAYNVATTDDLGSFSLGAMIGARQVEIVSSGFYFDEVLGALSPAPLTLRAVADLGVASTVNGNVLTTLERERVKALVTTDHLSFADAQMRAEEEILRVFHVPAEDIPSVARFSDLDISQPGAGNAALLAISTTLQGSSTVAELSELLAKIIDDIKGDGTLDDPTVRATLAAHSQALDSKAIRANLQKRYQDLGLVVTIPNFEDYLDDDGDGVVNKYDYQLLSPAAATTESLPTLDWSDSRLPGARYHVQVATDPEFTVILADAAQLTDSSYTLTTPLDDGQTCYWRVLVSGPNQPEASWAAVAQFRVTLSGIATVQGPGVPDGAGTTITNDVTPTFRWTVARAGAAGRDGGAAGTAGADGAAADGSAGADGGPGASAVPASFRFVLSTQADLSSPLAAIDGISATEVTLANALPGTPSTDYYWAVTPIEADGAVGRRSAVAHFILDTVAPTGTVIINGDGATTADETVSLALAAADANPISTMQLAESSDFLGTTARPFATAVDYRFAQVTENAPLTIYARFTDLAGNQSSVATDAILLKRTLISGVLTSAATWTPAGNPYLIRADVGVPAGLTLTIAPGTRVEYEGTVKLLVKGTLVAAGTAADPIVFTKHGAAANPDAIGLLFEDADLSASTLGYLSFRDLGHGLQVGNETEFMQAAIKNSGTLAVDHLDLLRSEARTSGYMTTAALVVGDLTATDSTVVGDYPRSEPITINRATLGNTTVSSEAYNAGITLTDAGLTGGHVIVSGGGANVVLQRCQLTGTAIDDGIVNDPYDNSDGTLEVDSTTLTSATIALPTSILNAADSVFTGAAGGGYSLVVGSGTITHCRFANSGSVGLQITGLHGSSVDAGTSIDATDISGHPVGVLLGKGDGYGDGTGLVTITGSNLTNNTLFAVQNLRASSVAATNDYWGTTTATDIAALIFDSNDALTSGPVSVDPAAAAPVAGTGPR
jgi:hypothetical protein